MIISLAFLTNSFAKEYKLFSPDKKTEVVITVDSDISTTTNYQLVKLFSVENISMDIEGEDYISVTGKIKKVNPQLCHFITTKVGIPKNIANIKRFPLY